MSPPSRWAPALPWMWALLLPALLLGPALGRGYLLTYDMVWVPDLALRPDFLGLGTALPRAVPSDAVVAVLDEVVPGLLLQKLVLYGALVLAAFGAMRLAARSVVGQLAAVSLTVWCPFVVERLWIGHWPMLLGYAAAPWLVLAGRRAGELGRIPASTYLLLALGSLSANAGLVSSVVLLACAAGFAGHRPRVLPRLALLCLAVNGPWIVAGLLHLGTATGGDAGVFALHAEGSLPAPLAALGLGGIWNTEVVPGSRQGPWAWVALAVVLALAVAGARAWWAREGRARALPLVVVWAIGYLLALATWATPGAVDWLTTHVSGAGLLRDGARSLVLCLPAYLGVVVAGVERVVGHVARGIPRTAVAVALVLLPVSVMTDAAWGIGGTLRPAEYPAGWAAARAAVASSDSAGDVLVLPFTSYRAPAWNRHQKVLDPLGRYLTPDYLSSDVLAVSGRLIGREDPRVPEVQRALALPGPAARAAALGRLGVRFVARERDAPGVGDPAYDGAVAGTRRYADDVIEVTEITDAVAVRSAGGVDRTGTALAWGTYVAVLLLGLWKILWGLRSRMVTGEETTATVRP